MFLSIYCNKYTCFWLVLCDIFGQLKWFYLNWCSYVIRGSFSHTCISPGVRYVCDLGVVPCPSGIGVLFSSFALVWYELVPHLFVLFCFCLIFKFYLPTFVCLLIGLLNIRLNNLEDGDRRHGNELHNVCSQFYFNLQISKWLILLIIGDLQA